MARETKPSKLPVAGLWPDRIAPIAALVGAIIASIGFLLAFLYASPVNGAGVDGAALIGDSMVSNKILISQKIFYFHMPVALVSFVALAFACYYSVRLLISREQRYDTCARIAMEIVLVFIICTMCTGEMWTRFEWGVWWTWEPRLTTYLILMLIVIAYFVLRSAIEDPERRSVYAAVIGIISFVDAPICLMVTRMIPSSLHPVVVREGGMTGDMAITLVFCLVGLVLLAFALYRLRFRQVRMQERVEAIKDQLDD